MKKDDYEFPSYIPTKRRYSKSSVTSSMTIKERERQIKLKQKAVDYKGGKCSVCGYNKCLPALEFHHLIESEKKSSFSQSKSADWNKVQPELDKCILVCSNCHREIHFSNHIKK